MCGAGDLGCTPCDHRNIDTLRGARSNLLRRRSPSCPAGCIPCLRCNASRVEVEAGNGQRCKSVSFFVSSAVLTNYWPTCGFLELCCFRICGANMDFLIIIFGSYHESNKNKNYQLPTFIWLRNLNPVVYVQIRLNLFHLKNFFSACWKNGTQLRNTKKKLFVKSGEITKITIRKLESKSYLFCLKLHGLFNWTKKLAFWSTARK